MSNTKKFQMKLNRRGKILWSIVAFSPLFLVLLLKFILYLFIEQNPLIKYNSIVIISVIVIVVCIFLTWLLLLWILNPGETEDLMEFECKINNSSNSDYGIFIVTYLVPFIFVNFSWVDLIPTGVMFIFIIAIYINSPIFAINPILGFFKYNIYNAVINNHSSILISKRKLPCKIDSMTLIQYGDNVYYDADTGKEDYK